MAQAVLQINHRKGLGESYYNDGMRALSNLWLQQARSRFAYSDKYEPESRRTGIPVPSNHNPGFAPVPEPTLKAAVTSMTAAVLELLGKK